MSHLPALWSCNKQVTHALARGENRHEETKPQMHLDLFTKHASWTADRLMVQEERRPRPECETQAQAPGSSIVGRKSSWVLQVRPTHPSCRCWRTDRASTVGAKKKWPSPWNLVGLLFSTAGRADAAYCSSYKTKVGQTIVCFRVLALDPSQEASRDPRVETSLNSPQGRGASHVQIGASLCFVCVHWCSVCLVRMA